MSTKAKLLACLAGAAIPCLLAVAVSAADEQFAVSKIIPVPGGLNSFDIGFVDANIHTYVLADRTNKSIDVVDTNTNTLTQLFASPSFRGLCTVPAVSNPTTVKPDVTFCVDASGPNGVIIVDQREVWAADAPITGPITCVENPIPPSGTFTKQQVCSATITTPSSLRVLDLKTGATIAVIPNGGVKRNDELCEDVKREVVMSANDDPADNFVTFTSTETYSNLQRIKLDGTDPNGKITLSPAPPHGSTVAADGIEQCKFNPRTHAYYLAVPATVITTGATTSPGPGVILKISEHAPFHVEETFTIPAATGCTGPQGLAIGPRHQIILGCGGASTASLIIDDRDGHVIHSLAGAGGADEVWYNPGDNQYFIAASNNAIPQLVVADPDGTLDPLTKTAAGSHSVAADMLKNQVYVPGNKAANALCTQLGGAPNVGCIAVFTAPNDDQCLAQGMPVLDHDDGDDPVFMRTRCRDHDDDDHDREARR
jgi:hypothetical protein